MKPFADEFVTMSVEDEVLMPKLHSGDVPLIVHLMSNVDRKGKEVPTYTNRFHRGFAGFGEVHHQHDLSVTKFMFAHW